MKKSGKKSVVILLTLLMSACLGILAACESGETSSTTGPSTGPTIPSEEDPYANIVEYNEETAEIFRFEAEEAVISAPLALKCSAMKYQGNGHVVKAEGGFAAGHFMQSDPSGSGSKEYGNAAFVGYMGAAVGDKITFVIDSKTACVANLTFLGKSSLHMSLTEDPTAMQYASMWNCDDTPIYVNGEKQEFEDTFFQLKVWAKTVELTNVRLKKGTNVIEIVAEKKA